MTKVVAVFDRGESRLTVKGHATGSELVCAAVSSIVYALVGYLRNAGEHIEDVLQNKIEDADVELHYRGDASVMAAFQMAYIGLAQIANGYPEFVVVHVGENAEHA